MQRGLSKLNTMNGNIWAQILKKKPSTFPTFSNKKKKKQKTTHITYNCVSHEKRDSIISVSSLHFLHQMHTELQDFNLHILIKISSSPV